MRDRSTRAGASTWLPWVLGVGVTIVGLLGWLDQYNWQVASLKTFSVFSLLGVLAWSIMWTHYAYGGLRLMSERLAKNQIYTTVTLYVVLALLLLHPGLLAYSQWDITKQLPPQSFYTYVGPSLKLYVLFGSLSLLMFLAYDILIRLRKHPRVHRYWRYISLSQMVAMSLIFVHSMQLGQTMDQAWFELYWVALGALLLPCFGLIIYEEWNTPSKKP